VLWNTVVRQIIVAGRTEEYPIVVIELVLFSQAVPVGRIKIYPYFV
jgi:hypothetical protein